MPRPGRHGRPGRLAPRFALALALLAASPQALAEEARPRDVRLTMGASGAWDAAYIGGAGLSFAVGSLLIPPRFAEVAPLDGLGRRERDETFELASDAALVGGLLTGVSLGFVFESAAGRRGFEALRAPLVLSEGALAASGVVHLLKNVGGVCRPRDWDEKGRFCGTEGERGITERGRVLESRRAFPSGHTAPLAGMAGAAFGLWLFPTGTRTEFRPLALTQGAFALAMVAFRPAAGAHSWVDTGTAFVIGAAMGVLTAALHTGPGEATAPPSPTAQQKAAAPASVSFGGSF